MRGVKGTVVLGLLLLVLATSCSAKSMKFGTSADTKYLTLDPGAQGVFKISVFSIGEEDIYVDFIARHPSDLGVEVYPPSILISGGVTTNPSNGGEWFILNDGKTYVRTYPIYVYVRVPDRISRNTYTIKLTAIARFTDDNKTSDIRQAMSQVREFTLTAYVRGSIRNSNLGIQNVETQGSAKLTHISGDIAYGTAVEKPGWWNDLVVEPHRAPSASQSSGGGGTVAPSGQDNGGVTFGDGGGETPRQKQPSLSQRIKSISNQFSRPSENPAPDKNAAVTPGNEGSLDFLSLILVAVIVFFAARLIKGKNETE